MDGVVRLWTGALLHVGFAITPTMDTEITGTLTVCVCNVPNSSCCENFTDECTECAVCM